MADRAKLRYRGKTYSVKSKRPGKKRVRVRPYCRRKPVSLWRQAQSKAKEWGF